ncbi:hypothetical protein [Alteribacillus sp. HJP-4]|uniref:hypothetical protein n=1 Tax=Alteribacillus sp. HJP-4 TaxID=2775394 RepID=UPI0035CCFF87
MAVCEILTEGGDIIIKVAEYSNGDYVIKDRIDKEKAHEIKKAIADVNSMHVELEIIKPLTKAYTSFVDWDTLDLFEVELRVSDFLFKVVSFVDRWNSYLKRENNDNTHLFNLFNKKLSEIYDNNIEYRIVYNLRNLSYHTHIPPFTDAVQSLYGESKLLLNVNFFIDNHKKMQGSFRTELKNDYLRTDLRIDLAIKKTYSELVKLNDLIINNILDDRRPKGLLKSAFEILKFYNQYNEKDEAEIILTNFDPSSGPPYEMDQIMLPYNYARFISSSFSFNIKLEGEIVGISPTLPFIKDGEIFTGRQKVTYDEIDLIRVLQSKSYSKNKYFAAYFVDGLRDEDYLLKLKSAKECSKQFMNG